MGWTSYYAQYYKNGKIDRKRECDAYFTEGYNSGCFEVVKSAMVGSTYYAAIKRTHNNDRTEIPEAERKTFAVVFLTRTKDGEFYYKDIDETCGPAERKCPLSIIKLLSETTSEWAQEWRNDCIKSAQRKKDPNTLENLPIGTKIQYQRHDGETVTLVKHPAAYQFKRPFWKIDGIMQYVKKTAIPNNYTIVTT